MRKYSTLFFLFLAIIFLFPELCYASAKRPAWVKNPDAIYPEQKYLVGIGHGNSFDAAKNSALAGISGFFEIQVISSVRTSEKEESLNVNDQHNFLHQSSIDREVQIQSEGKLQFAEIRETWEDSKSGTWYCLAVLEKASILDLFEQNITNAESQISLLLQKQTRVIDRIKNLQHALSVAEENEIYYLYYNAIASGIKEKKYPAIKSNSILEWLTEAKTQFPLGIRVNNDDGRVETALREVCAKNGLTCKNDSDFVMIVDIKETEPLLVNNQYFVRLDATLKIVKGEEIWAQSDAFSRQGDITLENARQRASTSLAGKLTKKFLEILGLNH